MIRNQFVAMLRLVCDTYGLSIEGFKTRHRPYVRYKQIIITVLYDNGHTLLEIANALNMNHATILYSVNLITDLKFYEKDVAVCYSLLEKFINDKKPIVTTKDKLINWINIVPDHYKQQLMQTICLL